MRRALALLVLVGCEGSSAPDASMAPDAAIAMDAATAIDASAPADAANPDAEETPMRTITAYGALGSSSTAGSGASRPELAYVPLIHARLLARQAGVQLINRGSGGARIDRLLMALPDLEAQRPELVTILPLTDYVQTTPDRFRTGYDELFGRLGAVGTTIFFGDLRIDPALSCGTGSGPGGCYGPEDQATLGAKNAVLLELVRAHPHVIVVPVFDQNAAHPEWNAPDGHPNDLGHTYLADTFFAAIAAWLDRP